MAETPTILTQKQLFANSRYTKNAEKRFSHRAFHAKIRYAKTKIGLRDRFLMIFLYDSGARISEALGVRLRDVKLGNSPQVLLFGKGNKVRAVPLMEKTVEHLQQYIAVFHKEESLTSAATLFYVLHKGKKEPMNDETVRVRLQKYAGLTVA